MVTRARDARPGAGRVRLLRAGTASRRRALHAGRRRRRRGSALGLHDVEAPGDLGPAGAFVLQPGRCRGGGGLVARRQAGRPAEAGGLHAGIALSCARQAPGVSRW